MYPPKNSMKKKLDFTKYIKDTENNCNFFVKYLYKNNF